MEKDTLLIQLVENCTRKGKYLGRFPSTAALKELTSKEVIHGDMAIVETSVRLDTGYEYTKREGYYALVDSCGEITWVFAYVLRNDYELDELSEVKEEVLSNV